MSTAPTMPPPSETPKPELSQPQRIINTFFDPKKTFTDLNRGTAWWMAFLLIAAFSYALVITVDKKIGFDQVVENNMKMASAKQIERMEQMPPDQRARMLSIQTKVTKYISYGYPVVALVIMVIFAALLMATFNFAAGASVPFGKSLAVVVYGSLPGIFRALLAIISIFAGKDPETFTFQNPAATNLGYFIDPLQHRFLYSLGSAVDIFGIWTLVLTAIGFTCVSKAKSGTSYAIVFGWYFGITLFFAGLGALFS